MDLEDGNETIYIQNLNEKIKPQDMKALLYQLFANYGNVVDVIVQSQYRMKGQAFVIFDSKSESENALRLLQGYYFYGKSLVTPKKKLSYANSKSDIIAKRDGVYIRRPATEAKQKRLEFFERLKLKNSMKRRNEIVSSNGIHGLNNILFLERLENSVTESFLAGIFGLYEGLKEVRLVAEKGVAFIEFDNADDAGKALMGLNGYKISPTCQFFITYAKRGN